MFTVTWLEKWVSRLELYLFVVFLFFVVFFFFFNTNEHIWLSCFSSIQLEFLDGKDIFLKKEKKKFTIGGGEAEEL